MANCRGQKKDGQPCTATAGADGFCFRHRPGDEAEAARREASARGGRGGRFATPVLDQPDVADIVFDSARDITGLCARVARWVLSGQVDSKAGNCAILAASTALRSLDVGEFEARLRQLEEQLGMKGVA